MSYSEVYNRKIFKNINKYGEEEIIYLLKEGCNNDDSYDWSAITNNSWYNCKTFRSDFVSREFINKGLEKLSERYENTLEEKEYFDLKVGSKPYSYKKFCKYLLNYERYIEDLSDNLIEYRYGNYYTGVLFEYFIGRENYIEILVDNEEMKNIVFENVLNRICWYVDKENFKVSRDKGYYGNEIIRIYFDIKYASHIQEQLGGGIVRVNNNYTGVRK